MTQKNSSLLQHLALWPHQRAAIKAIEHYLPAYRRGDTRGAALVHMPTGSGKTGVIASLARCVPGLSVVLVLSPRIGLRDQLYRDISGRFFSRLGVSEDRLPKRVILLADGTPAFLRTDLAEGVVLISTIQKLHSLSRRSDPFFGVLRKNLDLLVVDEGHYEPAPEWRNAIRALDAPKVIFTATPYRNDFKLFDIDYKYGHSYMIHQAVTKWSISISISFNQTNTPQPPAHA